MRQARPPELARYFTWCARFLDRANTRWRQVKPRDAPLQLFTRDGLSHAICAALADLDDKTTPGNRKQASRFAAAFYADRPDQVRAEANCYLRAIYERAIKGDS
jgi:hypothetical protein